MITIPDYDGWKLANPAEGRPVTPVASRRRPVSAYCVACDRIGVIVPGTRHCLECWKKIREKV
jgi:hypothetical protein